MLNKCEVFHNILWHIVCRRVLEQIRDLSKHSFTKKVYSRQRPLCRGLRCKALNASTASFTKNTVRAEWLQEEEVHRRWMCCRCDDTLLTLKNFLSWNKLSSPVLLSWETDRCYLSFSNLLREVVLSETIKTESNNTFSFMGSSWNLFEFWAGQHSFAY